VTDALAYVEYVTNTLRNKEIFHSIDIKFLRAWDVLMWSDPSNYGGIRSKLPTKTAKKKKAKDNDESEEEEEEEGTEFDSDDDTEDGEEINLKL